MNNPVLKNIDLTNKVEIKENEHQNKVKRNDILFNTSSETPEEVATSTVVDVNQNNLYLNSFCFGFRPNVQFSNYYIGYYLRSNHFRSRVFCLAQGISRYNISKKSLIKLKLSLPKLEEQDKISRIFNQIELLLTLYERKIEKLESIYHYFQKNIFKHLYETKDTLNLGDFVSVNTGKLDANAMCNDGKYDFYTSGIKKYKINSFSFSGPAITVAGNGATIGYLHLADGKFDAYQRTYVINNFQGVSRKYIYYTLQYVLPRKIYKESRTGSIYCNV